MLRKSLPWLLSCIICMLMAYLFVRASSGEGDVTFETLGVSSSDGEVAGLPSVDSSTHEVKAESAARLEVSPRVVLLKVKTKEGDPIEGVEVRLVDASFKVLGQYPDCIAKTDGSGRVFLGRSVMGQAAGIQLDCLDFLRGYVETDRFDHVESLEVVLIRAAYLGLKVVDSEGAPLAGVLCCAANRHVSSEEAHRLSVRAAAISEPLQGFTEGGITWGVTDSLGQVKLTGLAPGVFSMAAEHANYIVSDLLVGSMLPTEGRVTMIRPRVVLADLPLDGRVVWWTMSMPDGATPQGLAQRAVGLLQSRIKAKFPNTICGVAAPASFGKPNEASVELLDRELGWVTARVRLREFSADIAPEPLEYPFGAKRCAMGEIVLRVSGADGSEWPLAADATWEIAPAELRGLPRRSRTVALRPGIPVRLPVGKYVVTSPIGIVAAAIHDARVEVIPGGVSTADVKISHAIALVQLSAKGDRGHPIESGSVVASNGSQSGTYLFNDAMDGAWIWVPGGSAKVRFYADGHEEMIVGTDIQGGTKGRIEVVCQRPQGG